jgi:hypothetical protein
LTFGRCQELGEQYARGIQASNIRQRDLAVILMKPIEDIEPVYCSAFPWSMLGFARRVSGDRAGDGAKALRCTAGVGRGRRSYCTSRGMALTVDETNVTVTPVFSQ